MKIINCEQRSTEWRKARSGVFTASEVGEFVAEEKEVRLTVAEITAMLQAQGIEPPKKSLKPDLVALLPNAAELATWTQSTINARKKIIRAKLADPFYTDPAFADLAGAAWLVELRAKAEKAMEYNPAVQRGIDLEPLARAQYLAMTGYGAAEVGFCIHDSGGFGCSPDGLIYSRDWCGAGDGEQWHHGLEIKCPIPETHIEYLDDGGLPDSYRPQVHASMAVTGLSRWDFLSFCPGLPPLLLTVERDEYTERMLAGLLSLADELKETKARMKARWEAFNTPKP